MSRAIIIKANKMEKSIEVKNILTSKFEARGIRVFEEYEENAELVVSIGGDGTFLTAIKEYRFKDIPLIGINTGHLGFLTELTANDMDRLVNDYLEGTYSTHFLDKN